MAGPSSTRYRYDVFPSHSSTDKPLVCELADPFAERGVLQQQRDAGRHPEEIRQIECVGEALDMASVLRLRRRILFNQVAQGE